MVDIDIEDVKSAKAGNDEAFARIYESVYVDMYKYSYYMLGNEQDAQDIVSDTVMEVYKNISKLRKDELFRQWIFKILSNKCKMKRKEYSDKNAFQKDNEFQGNVIYDENYELKNDINNAFMILSDEEKSIVSMAVFGGYKSSEIGKILKIRAVTVRSKLSRALSKMESKLQY